MSVADNFDQIYTLCKNLAPSAITVLPISKTFAISAIQELYDHGIRDFGESRLSELQEKSTKLPSDIKWHYIGNLQSKKVRKIVQLCHTIHSVSSVELIERLERICGEERQSVNFLLELNVSGESCKTGAAEDMWHQMANLASQTKNCHWQGLMTMTPEEASTSVQKNIFNRLKSIRDDWQIKYSCNLPILSMGMSNDYPSAIASGSTLIRIGTAIFGDRDSGLDENNGRNQLLIS